MKGAILHLVSIFVEDLRMKHTSCVSHEHHLYFVWLGYCEYLESTPAGKRDPWFCIITHARTHALMHTLPGGALSLIAVVMPQLPFLTDLPY